MFIRAAVTTLLVSGLILGIAALQPTAAAAGLLTVYANNMPSGSTDLEFAADGSMYVTGGSGGAGKLYKVPPGGGAGSELVSSGLFRPWGLAFNPSGTLYMVDYGDATVANNGKIYTVSPTGTLTVFKSGLNGPMSIVFDPAGNLYVGMNSQNKVIMITPGGVQTDYATGLGINSGEQVMQISFDESGNLYAGVEQDIYKIGLGGSPVTKVINGGLGQAMGHVRWAGDNFFVSTFGFHFLRHASPSNGIHNITANLAGNCTDGLMPSAASVFNPVGMRLWHDRVYVADQGCHTVRVFDMADATAASQRTWGQLKILYR